MNRWIDDDGRCRMVERRTKREGEERIEDGPLRQRVAALSCADLTRH